MSVYVSVCPLDLCPLAINCKPVALWRGDLAGWQVWPCKALAWRFGRRLPVMTMQSHGTVVHGAIVTCCQIARYDSWKPLSAPGQKQTSTSKFFSKDQARAPREAPCFKKHQTGEVIRVLQFPRQREAFQRGPSALYYYFFTQSASQNKISVAIQSNKSHGKATEPKLAISTRKPNNTKTVTCAFSGLRIRYLALQPKIHARTILYKTSPVLSDHLVKTYWVAKKLLRALVYTPVFYTLFSSNFAFRNWDTAHF